MWYVEMLTVHNEGQVEMIAVARKPATSLFEHGCLPAFGHGTRRSKPQVKHVYRKAMTQRAEFMSGCRLRMFQIQIAELVLTRQSFQLAQLFYHMLHIINC